MRNSFMIISAIFLTGCAMTFGTKSPSWMFVHTAAKAEMTSKTTLVMPATREIFAFTERPDRLHRYLKADEYVSLWDKSEGGTFSANPPNSILTWIDGNEVHETGLLITDAKIVGAGGAIEYKVELEVGDQPHTEMKGVSFFVDSVNFNDNSSNVQNSQIDSSNTSSTISNTSRTDISATNTTTQKSEVKNSINSSVTMSNNTQIDSSMTLPNTNMTDQSSSVSMYSSTNTNTADE